MNTLICEDASALGRASANWCARKISSHNAKSIFVPAGNTPVALYKEWEAERPDYLRGLSLLQIDDVLTGSQKGVFKDFFREHLPSYSKQLKFIDDGAASADIAVLGLGLNGHVAFHEPEMARDFYSGCVKLSDITCQNLKLERGTWGVSYGCAAFLRARSILIMVSGASKQDVLSRLFDADPSLPASLLLKHPDITVLADRAALGLVNHSHARQLEI